MEQIKIYLIGYTVIKEFTLPLSVPARIGRFLHPRWGQLLHHENICEHIKLEGSNYSSNKFESYKQG